MDHCFVEFEPKDKLSLRRLADFLELIKAAKQSEEAADEPDLAKYLSDVERSYFWDPTPEEMKEWGDEWFSTPVALRHSPQMPIPQWTLDSMIQAFWDGDYELLGVVEEDARHRVAFNPHGYPYGGTGALIAVVECFGHTVLGVEDGTGYAAYESRTNRWKPKAQRSCRHWLARLFRDTD